ncbi:MAG TPA: DUF2207 domain-containing protein [Propionibacteriaceae bacterium]|nr:DUF2207 domain-containing protein [Propionibacteriaceae bacterium]
MLANFPRTLHRIGAMVAFCVLTCGLLAGPLALTAHAEGTASTFIAEGNLAKDGTLKVKQTITLTGAVPAELSQRFETREDLVGDRQYVQKLSDITAAVKGTQVQPTIKTEDRFTTVTVPTNGSTEIVMMYTVTGAVVTLDDDSGTALRWRMLQGLSASVTQFTATVQIPTQFSYIKCTAGGPNSTIPCNFAAAGTESAQIPTFRDGPRGEGEVVAIDIGFPPGGVATNEVIDYRWTVGRAFSAEPLQLVMALGLLALGGVALYGLHRRAGVDSSPDGQISKAGEFVPTGAGQSEFRVVGDVRPGHVGTVADERVDPIDVTATLIDLAVRGHLVINELPRESEFARTDWEIRRVDGDGLLPFEQQLVDGIAAPGSSVRVSDLAGKVQESIGGVQNALYDEMVSNGWFERRPDETRNRWTQLALAALIISVVLTGVLAAFTTFGLVGLALIVLSLGLVFVAQEMPARTAEGTALLGGLGALRSDLLSHPTNQMPPGGELREISELLPYAIVLGGSDRWLDAMVASDADEHPDSDDLSWYRGPENWHLRDLPDSIKNFVTTVSGSLFSR